MGEVAVTKACSDKLMTVSIAPHQVYGPRDNLFLPNILEVTTFLHHSKVMQLALLM
jgi:hypothetical protein